MENNNHNDATDQLDSEISSSDIEKHMGLVVLIAKSFNPIDEEQLEEFVQMGRIAVWRALQKHDPSRAKLSTVMWYYIKWEILRHLKKVSRRTINFKEFLHGSMDDSLFYDNNKVEQIKVGCGTNKFNSNFWEFLPECLTRNEKSVIDLRLQGHTFLEIGEELGYSRGWANNTFKKAVNKIQNGNQ